MAPQVWKVFRDHHEMTFPDFDGSLAPRAEISLASRIRLDRGDHFLLHRRQPRSAQITSAITIAIVPATRTMSRLVLR